MAAYTNIANIKRYMPTETIRQLTDDSNSGVIDTDVVDDVIDMAQKTIDGYMRGRYPANILVESDIPPMIVDICTKLASYNLYHRTLPLTMPESLTEDKKTCERLLLKIQEGKITPFEKANEPDVILTNKTALSRDYNSAVWNTY